MGCGVRGGRHAGPRTVNVPTSIASSVIIPIGTDRPLARRTFVTYALIAANIVVFAVELSQRHTNSEGLNEVNWMLEQFDLGRETRGDLWRFVTYQFLHDPYGWMHIVGNMLFLFVFGPNLEDRLGRLGFLAFYLVGGILAGIAHIAVSPHPVLGASGAIAAVTGAYLVLFPKTSIKILFFFFLIGIYEVPAWAAVLFAIGRDILTATSVDPDVSWQAHLGGYAFGIVVTLLLLVTKILPRERWDLLGHMGHAARRREIREAARMYEDRSSRVKSQAADEPRTQQLAARRAEVSAFLAQENVPAAADAYASLLSAFPEADRTATLTRQNQILVANEFFRAGRYAEALRAYELFASTYERDPQTPHARLVAALIRVRYLPYETDAARLAAHEIARDDLRAAASGLDAEDAELARQLEDELLPIPESNP